MLKCPECNKECSDDNMIRCANLTFDTGKPEYPFHKHYENEPIICCKECLNNSRNKCFFCDNIMCDGEMEECSCCIKIICPDCQGENYCVNSDCPSAGYDFCETCSKKTCECGSVLKCPVCQSKCLKCNQK